MRVLFVTHSYPRWGGDTAGAFVHRLALALGVAGVEVRVIAPSARSLPLHDTVDGVVVERFRYAPRGWETLAYEGTMAEQVRRSLRAKLSLTGMLGGAVLAVRNSVGAFRPTVVHAHWWFPSALAATWGSGAVPLVTTLHGSDVRLARTSRTAQVGLRRVVAHSAAVTAVSSWLSTQATAMAPALRASVAPMPVDTDLFTPAGVRSATRLLFVGRLNRQKGIALLLEALGDVRADASLDVVGAGPDRDALVAQSDGPRLKGRVRFHGALSQRALLPMYRSAAAVVVPSEDEGLGLVAVEAQLCETAVIAFDSGGLRDLITSGSNGVLTPAGDVRALVAALELMLDNPARAAAMGRVGRELAVQRFSSASVAKRYVELYERVTS